MKRREFLTLIGGAAAAWPLAARGQQAVMTIPVIGFLASSSADAPSGPVAAIHLALKQAGYEVGQAVRMEIDMRIISSNGFRRWPTSWSRFRPRSS